MKPLRSALALAVALSLSACGGDDPAALIASAKGYIAKHDYNASVIQLKNVLQNDPDNAEARYLLAIASLEQRDLVSAQVELEKAERLGYAADELKVASARLALAKGEVDKMLKEFSSVRLATAKPQAELRALVGHALLARNERAEARKAFDEALELEPANTFANLGAARLAALEQNLSGALAKADAALAGAPLNADALLFKADLLAAKGEKDAAEKTYRDAVQAAPNQVPSRLALITHLLRSGSLDEANTELVALEKAAPRDPRTAYAKALLLLEAKKFPAAREAIQQVLKAAPNHVPSLVLAGMAAYQTGAFPEAESHLRKAVLNAPGALGAKRLLAATHLRMGKTDLAVSEVGELLKVSEHPSILALAAEAHLANGDTARAADLFERARSLAPKNASVQTRLALVRLAAGDQERGITELQAASANDPESHHADLALIANFLRLRQAEKALAAIDTLEKKQPNNPVTHNLRGAALLLKRDAAGARASFERALQLQPTYIAAVNNLVQLDIREKNPERAKKRYEAVLKQQPNNEQALIGLAVLLRVMGADAKEIESTLKQAVAGNPTSVNARTSLVGFYLNRRDVKTALAAAQEAQAAIPNNAVITRTLGLAQLAASDTRQAVVTFTRLAEMQPKSAEPHVYLARAHLAGKQPDEAIKALRNALAVRPELGSIERDIVAVYLATGRADEALREARAVQKESPDQPLGYVLEGEIHASQKAWDKAERVYRQALKKFDMPIIAARTHAMMLAGGKKAEADALASDWVNRHPKDAVVLSYLGDREVSAKRFGEAAKHYRKALERQPENPRIMNNLAWALGELKDAAARQYAERANDAAPDNPAIMDTLGTILVGSGEMERGLQLLGRASELAPGAHEIRLHFAKALIKADRKAAARKELDVLAKLDNRLPVQQQAAALLKDL